MTSWPHFGPFAAHGPLSICHGPKEATWPFLGNPSIYDIVLQKNLMIRLITEIVDIFHNFNVFMFKELQAIFLGNLKVYLGQGFLNVF